MAHFPAFPPKWSDFAPGNPFKREPPIPRFFFNPWLTSEQASTMEVESGHWAARRAEAMISPADGFEVARRLARSMYESMKARSLAIPIAPPPIAAPTKKAKAGKKAKRLEIDLGEELAPLVGILTAEQDESLTDSALEEIINYKQRHRGAPMPAEAQAELAMAVVDWASEAGAKIGEAKGKEIVKKALSRLAPVKA